MQSANVITPQILATIIASAGSANTIPITPSGTFLASQQEGFPAITMIPKTSGGQNPAGQDFNGLMKLLSSHNFFLQNGSQYTFNPTLSAAIGGYPKGAMLWNFPSSGSPQLLQSLIENNTNNFNSNFHKVKLAFTNYL